ncbi:hypothetical protein AVEN_244381-1 [Araneus ventricosus]|uniref:STPR domain-containing protein n=2 Tax=Araneus ventricosus TaxID=182803 RepID=A0A4Y2JMP6_ARAVE|nr:hypothetical protein AVEN_244381-1 [Araneus ventricosus]
MAQRGQKRRTEETEEQRNRGLSHMAQHGLERKTEETEEQRNGRLSDMAQRSQERSAKEIRRTKEWSIVLVENLLQQRFPNIFRTNIMSSEATNSDFGAIQGVEKTLLKATELLEKHFGYTNRKILYSGSFGWVIGLNYPQRKKWDGGKGPSLQRNPRRRTKNLNKAENTKIQFHS